MKEVVVAITVVAFIIGFVVHETNDRPDDFETTCVGGHEYWLADTGYEGYLGIKLTDDGKPVLCE